MALANIGLIGLAVMGQNLVLNMQDHGFSVAVFNRSTDKVDSFLKQHHHPANIIGCHSIETFIAQLQTPRCIMLMVRAGEAVDDTIATLLPHLSQGDIVIDGGNSHFLDSSRRFHLLKAHGIRFIGMGVSGGEEGARFGPSIMPGGDATAWPVIQPIFEAIAAKTNGEPCCRWIGPEGSGHFVKMVHNGIEYGDMQLIAEAYDLLHRGAGLSADELHQVFAEWNKGVLDSYLIDITANILAKTDSDGSPLLDRIVDNAGQKGTGKWTVNTALEEGSPLTLIAEAVFARVLSAKKTERVKAEQYFDKKITPSTLEKTVLINAVHDAVYAAKIISYTQGFMLLLDAAKAYQWPLNYGDIALMWRGGCIIRSRFLGDINKAFIQNPQLDNLLFDEFFRTALTASEQGWRTTVKTAIDCGIPVPALASALAFFDGYTSGRLPANLLQAQRDYFGAHTYERTDQPAGTFFHTDWAALGSAITSGTYNA
jgi:6-phosphogluconate dehydrogenase